MTQQENSKKTALHILLSGRSLDADTAKDIGLVDELAEGDALLRATELARAFITGENGQALKNSLRATPNRCSSMGNHQRTFPKRFLHDEEIQNAHQRAENIQGRAKSR
jgi:enoyl-CoA hydratase/carnithine racemase